MFLKDFQEARVEVFDKKYRLATLFRDQGHEARVRLSYEMVQPFAPERLDAAVEAATPGSR